MIILQAMKQLRDDIKDWVTTNLNVLNAKIDEKTIPIDSELSTTSTNPIQNKAVAEAINNIPTFSGDYDICEDGAYGVQTHNDPDQYSSCTGRAVEGVLQQFRPAWP